MRVVGGDCGSRVVWSGVDRHRYEPLVVYVRDGGRESGCRRFDRWFCACLLVEQDSEVNGTTKLKGHFRLRTTASWKGIPYLPLTREPTQRFNCPLHTINDVWFLLDHF